MWFPMTKVAFGPLTQETNADRNPHRLQVKVMLFHKLAWEIFKNPADIENPLRAAP